MGPGLPGFGPPFGARSTRHLLEGAGALQMVQRCGGSELGSGITDAEPGLMLLVCYNLLTISSVL